MSEIRDGRNARNILMVKVGKCPRGMLERAWENSIATGLKKGGCHDGKWIQLAKVLSNNRLRY